MLGLAAIFKHDVAFYAAIGMATGVALGYRRGAKDAGKLRSEGKDYIVQDGDVILFRFNV